MTTYAVTWVGDDGARSAGRLELGPDALHLAGAVDTQTISYERIRTAAVSRHAADRIDGRPALVLNLLDGARLRIASVVQTLVLAELVERLGLMVR